MTEDIVRYDILVQNALRGVIRKVLSEVGKTGLPGNHHFFITFVTTAPGVRISNRIREQYPEQMTIVLQHQFWELDVGETGFSIGLSFSDVPEKLYVPYAAVRGFYDPSVNFELEFDVAESGADAGDDPGEIEDVPAGAGDEQLPGVAEADKAHAGKDQQASDGEQGGKAEIVSLDAFRKKK